MVVTVQRWHNTVSLCLHSQGLGPRQYIPGNVSKFKKSSNKHKFCVQDVSTHTLSQSVYVTFSEVTLHKGHSGA